MSGPEQGQAQPWRHAVLRFHPTERTMHTGRWYSSAKEAAHVAQHMQDFEVDDAADIRVVDELEFLALAVGRRVNLPEPALPAPAEEGSA